MYRNLYVILGGCSILLAIFFTAFNGSADGRADYVWVNGAEPETLDVARMTGQPDGEIAIAIFEGLTVYHPETLAPLPGVAESWDVDGLTVTFHLRPNSWWVKQGKIVETNGRKRNVTSGDFVYAWMRHCLPETGSQYSNLLDYIEGVEAFKAETAEQWRTICDGRKKSGLALPQSPKELEPAERDEVESFRRKLWDKKVGIRAPDERTLQVTLKAFVPFFLQITNFYPLMPVPREAVEEHGKEWILPRNILCNGPYLLDSWRFNFKIRLKKNPHYWETSEYVDARTRDLERSGDVRAEQAAQIELWRKYGSFEQQGLGTLDALAIEKEDTALNLYLNGDNDKVRSLPTHVVGDLLKENASRPIPDLHHSVNPTIYYFDINLGRPVFQSGEPGRKLRQALALAIDRKRLIRDIARAHQVPAYSMVPEIVRGYNYESRFGSGDFAKDVSLARQLVSEAKAAGLKPPNLRILYNTMEAHKSIAAFIQDQWKQNIGVESTLENQEWQTYLNSRRSGQFDVARAGWIPDYSDPTTYLDMFTSDNFDSDKDPTRLDRPMIFNPQNHPKYNNPHYNRIVLQYCSRLPEYLDTADKRKAIVADIQSWGGFGAAIEGAGRRTGTSSVADLQRTLDEYGTATNDPQRFGVSVRIRLLLLEIAEQMLMHDMPIIPLYHYTMTELWDPRLEGVWMNERDVHPPRFLRWKDGKRPTGTRYRDFPQFWPRLDDSL